MSVSHGEAGKASTLLLPRVARIAAAAPEAGPFVEKLLDISRKGLPEMFLPQERVFAFRRALRGGDTVLEGKSLRYSAIVVLGARFLDGAAQRRILGGESALEYCQRLIDLLPSAPLQGDLALLTWAAAELEHPQLDSLLERLRESARLHPHCSTVTAAWCLSAWVAAGGRYDVKSEVREMKEKLFAAFSPAHGIFAPFRRGAARLRSHVGSFADQVYPIIALSRLHHEVGDPEALGAAARCAEQICRLQGEDGQWWWHYDSRNGRLIEGYPVYSVHQDGMAPLALLELAEAGGPDFSRAVAKGLAWLQKVPEVGQPLVTEHPPVIWRKVARKEPRKLVRRLRALGTTLHPDLRLAWLDRMFPARAIDWECRPYHLGWILRAWLGRL